MISLLDTNFLIALFDAAHVHHSTAQAWFGEHRESGWATCPITENGCIRVLSQPRYPGFLPVADIARRLRAATSASDHSFWPDAVSLCDAKRFHHDRLLTSKAVTDVYLLALAVANHGRLATFDRAIALGTVAGAQAKHLVVV